MCMELEKLTKLIEEYPWEAPDVLVVNRKGISRTEFILLAIESQTTSKLAEHFGCVRQTITRVIKKYFSFDTKSQQLHTKFLLRFELKKCTTCSTIKSFDSFNNNATRAGNKGSRCRDCDKNYYNDNAEKIKERRKDYRCNARKEINSRTAKRRAAKLNRTPAWANQEKIQEIYKTCPDGHHVDHIVPLQGENVSGLHVHENLQHLPAAENLSKGNTYVENSS
jgi:hypothetical protein